MGAFAQTAELYRLLGLAPTPTGGVDGKRPLLRGYATRTFSVEGARVAALKFADANVALLTGASRLNVVDVDDPSLLRPMLCRFGDTPIIVKTGGRGGFQLYYRASPLVKAANLRITESIDVEIRAGGNIVVAPPSQNPKTGRRYEFVEGDFNEKVLAQLPRMDATAVFNVKTAADHRKISEGHRNTVLFSLCLREAHYVDDFDVLLDVARTRNDEAEPPLPDSEVTKIVRSAWNYTERGRNFVGSSGNIILDRERVAHFCRDKGNPVAFALRLELEHGARVKRGQAFALSRRAMADAQTILGWTERNYRTAIDAARKLGFIKCVRSQTGVHADFVLPHLVPGGTKIGPNVTTTPFPASQGDLTTRKRCR